MEQLTDPAVPPPAPGGAPPRTTGARRDLPRVTALDLFERHVAARPDAVALAHGDSTLTYGELDGLAARYATELTRAGIARGAVVGVLASRSPAWVAALLAVWKAGGVYLPLDPAHPADRTAFALAECNAGAVLTETRFAAAPAGGPPRVILDGPPPAIAEGAAATSPDAPEPGAAGAGSDPDGPAYVIYTSGSTGVPKGVSVGHRALLNTLVELADAMECEPGTRWITMAPFTFDIAMAELCLPLTTGARLVLTSEADLMDAALVVRLIREHGVSRMQAVPSQWRALLDAGFDAPEMIAMTGGEALSPALARRLRLRVRCLINAYGPTETAIVSTIWRVPCEPVDVSIGEPIANTRLRLLDERYEPVGPGEAGELYIAGEGVALGYVAGPGLTGERFVTDPYGPPGARMYRTGDVCRWRPDGMLAFLGRADGQVKIRGQRVELGEVETGLAGHPAVAAVAAAVHDDSLVAYVVLAPGAERDTAGDPAASIRDHARRALPASMVPNLVRVLAGLPLTPNGKIDRSALPALAAVSAGKPVTVSAETRAAGEDEWVRAVCEVCREVLGVPAVLPGDDLAELGAHSLTLMQISARMRALWGVEVPVDVFYDTERVADAAAAVAELL